MAIQPPALRMWGRFEHSLDDKGRVIVPLKFRDKLGEEFVLAIGPGHHIRVYPMPIWENMEEQLVSTDIRDELNPDLVFLQRMFGNCEYASSDQQNRLSIPRHLREWAGLRENETAIILGSGTRLEIWSRANWEAYSQDFTEDKAARARGFRKPQEAESDASAVETERAVVETRGDSAPN